jgi:uncharacterized protein YjbI with pentapeptide repeats
MSEQQAGEWKSACPHPEAVGTRWGDPISEERQAELKALADKQREWAAKSEAERGESPLNRWPLLTGADVFWLAEASGREWRNGPVPDLHLEGAFFNKVHLEGANLDGAHLEGATLGEAHLEGIHLVGAHLKGVRLVEAHLEGGRLDGAHMEGAFFSAAHLERANLGGARMEGVYLAGAHLETLYVNPMRRASDVIVTDSGFVL